MAPKEKKKKRKGSRITYTGPAFDYCPPTAYELGVRPFLFVRCKICSTALPHLNFEWPAVPTELTLGAIKDAIVKRHGGGLPRIHLYKDMVHPEHSLAKAPDGATLKELGVEGAYMSSPDTVLPVLLLYYDFTAARFDDAVAAVEPAAVESKHDVSLKLYRQLTSTQRSFTKPENAPANGLATSGGGTAAVHVR